VEKSFSMRTDGQREKQTDRQTDRHTDTQTDTHTVIMKPVFAVRNCFVEFSKTKRQGNKKFIIELRKTATDF
jgi:hypothetical protein